MSDEEKENDPKSDPAVLHEVDGIKEYDNKLPNWWLYTLYATVAFAVLYWYHYEVTGFGTNPKKAYQEEMDRIASIEASKHPVTAESLIALSKDPARVQQGKEIFTSTCAACHRADGGGNVGPNLTDAYWLHGSAPEAIHRTIDKGVPDKGMPAWGPQLGAIRTQAVAAYVISIRGTNVAGGKPPQGSREELTLR
jgi:cytochrome c oxidase cbb3-type subunit 3